MAQGDDICLRQSARSGANLLQWFWGYSDTRGRLCRPLLRHEQGRSGGQHARSIRHLHSKRIRKVRQSHQSDRRTRRLREDRMNPREKIEAALAQARADREKREQVENQRRHVGRP